MNNFKIAILVDGDNAEPKLFENIYSHILEHGRIVIKRVYCDTKTTGLRNWEKICEQYSMELIKSTSVVKNKNSTDFSLISDGLKILYTQNIDIFFILTSDSDFIFLTDEIKNANKKAYGVGNMRTPEIYRNSCYSFWLTEQYYDFTLNSQKLHAILRTTLDKAGKGEMILMSNFGRTLKKLYPYFNFKDLGYRSLKSFIESIPQFEICTYKDGQNLAVKRVY
ncbi:NYN domain-containing protein [Saccharicrinis sp. FJH54]|uniref:NYN domain-containing protein n=1 Tax=Saccharicrinis sp. FJH54 TaxID=3344665 RepID=UPI0035D4BE74